MELPPVERGGRRRGRTWRKNREGVDFVQPWRGRGRRAQCSGMVSMGAGMTYEASAPPIAARAHRHGRDRRDSGSRSEGVPHPASPERRIEQGARAPWADAANGEGAARREATRARAPRTARTASRRLRERKAALAARLSFSWARRASSSFVSSAKVGALRLDVLRDGLFGLDGLVDRLAQALDDADAILELGHLLLELGALRLQILGLALALLGLELELGGLALHGGLHDRRLALLAGELLVQGGELGVLDAQAFLQLEHDVLQHRHLLLEAAQHGEVLRAWARAAGRPRSRRNSAGRSTGWRGRARRRDREPFPPAANHPCWCPFVLRGRRGSRRRTRNACRGRRDRTVQAPDCSGRSNISWASTLYRRQALVRCQNC